MDIKLDVPYAEFISTANAALCVAMLAALSADLKNALDPNSLQNRIAANARNIDPDIYCEQRQHEFIQNMEMTIERFKRISGIR